MASVKGLGLEKNQDFLGKSEIASCKNREKSKNIFKSYTLPVLVSLPIAVVGLNVDQIGLNSYDPESPDSDLVTFEAKSAQVCL